ncbi:alpha/beta fold hydrolase [Actinokineospora guangxiensis]|uniref:Alpha/beta fold hydrolase n=1 Tax=Actinokineospora guangxiensis TaxID=1490288 RepID=A0ABW0ELL4_9PSEU
MRDVVDFGGDGPTILLLHGLMGRATTWWPQARWLARHGRVLALDARSHGRSGHRGPHWRTPDFVADVAAVLAEHGPGVVVGHSMGALHGLGAAALHPELVTGLVVEDMAVDLRGRTVEQWRGLFDAWPVPFRSLAHLHEFFGPVVGPYFAECVEEREDGYHLLSDVDDLFAIAAEWGEREYWSWVDAVRCPMLVVEAEHTAMPPGQQAEIAARAGGAHIVVAGAGHLVQASAPAVYRGAVEAFLAGLDTDLA